MLKQCLMDAIISYLIFKTEITGLEYFTCSNLYPYEKLSENNSGKQQFYCGNFSG